MVVNNRTISFSSNTYPPRAHLESLLKYGEDTKKSLLVCECFYKDEKLHTVDDNPELRKRYELTKNSKTLDIIGPYHSDIFQPNRY